MAKECNYCGFRDPLPFTCKFCGGTFCYNHRLPESHDCPGLSMLKERARDSGRYSLHEPAVAVKKPGKNIFDPLIKALSIITSNYSLTILAIAIVSFFLENIPGYFSYLALSPSDMLYQPWKFALNLVTHMFLHSGPIHLLFNMMFLFFFGPELERRIGGKRFLFVFFLSGIIAGTGYSLWSLFILHSAAPAVGASGALFGIFACLAVLAPHIQVYIYFIPMKITYALIFFALFDLVFIGSGDAIARSAHLSGVVAGLVIGKHIKESGQYQRY